MLTLRTTWTITHERPLEPSEDPLTALGGIDPDMLLWASEEGAVSATVEIIEQS